MKNIFGDDIYYLHSSMVGLNLFAPLCLQRSLNLHSSMVGLNLRISRGSLKDRPHLHSSMVGLNLSPGLTPAEPSRFTFQYGGIKLKYQLQQEFKEKFTFQYGGIKPVSEIELDEEGTNLHSSMVGLNRSSARAFWHSLFIYIPVWWD